MASPTTEAPVPTLPIAGDEHLYFEDHGTGRPVVLIHGWPLSSRSWEPQVLPLVEAGYRVVTYDRRGFGASSRPFEGYDYDTFVADLAALLEHLDLREVTLVGFSMGGGEVARYLATHGSERVSQAVFAAAVPPALHADDGGALDDATIGEFEDAVRGDRLAFLEQFTTDFVSANDESKVSEELRRHLWNLGSVASPKGTLECIAAFGRTDFRGDLATITVPTLVLHGDADAIVPLEASGARTAEAIEGARLHVFEEGPHAINASHADEFNRVLLEFLGS